VSISARPFRSEYGKDWDDLVGRSVCGTFLHSRRFLSYHGDRFRDLSICLYIGDSLVGVFPAAADPVERECVTSHPGATYGGIVHDGVLRGAMMLEAFAVIRRYYSDLGLVRLSYKAVPRIYHLAPAEDDLYALFRLSARRYRCDLAAAIDLPYRLPISRCRKRSFKAALANGVTVLEKTEGISSSFWSLLEETLQRRHQARPVHTYEEMVRLQSLFPDKIRLVIAQAGEELLGGVILFVTPAAVHAQYSCASERGFSLHALDPVFEHCIADATRAGARWFSLGISNEADGRVLNESLHRFKTQFGAGGVVHEFYEVHLR
jgi:hypothetical protein